MKALKMTPAKKDVIFYNAQYSMMEHYLNDVVVKELIECPAYDVVRKYLMDLAANTVPDFEILNSKEKFNVVMPRSDLQRSCARTFCDLLKHGVKFYCR